MRVYFVRHGESECNRLDLRCGWSETPLSETGRKQALAAKEYLSTVHFDKVFCSDLPRAVETARLALPGAELILSDKIREISVGSLSNRPASDCEAEYGEQYRESIRLQDFKVYGGESQQEMKRRVQSFIKDLEKLEGLQNVAVVAHEGTVLQMLSVAMKKEVLLEWVDIQNTSVSVFEYQNGFWKLILFNYTGRL